MSISPHSRTRRVGEVLREELGRLFIDGLRDPRIGFVTVTEVRVSADLRNARVYVSIYGTEEERRASLAGLRDASGFLQREVGRHLRLKYTPELSFALDDSLDRAERLERLMDAIDSGAREPPEPEPVERLPVRTERTDLAERARSFSGKPSRPVPRRRRWRRR